MLKLGTGHQLPNKYNNKFTIVLEDKTKGMMAWNSCRIYFAVFKYIRIRFYISLFLIVNVHT